MRGLILSVLWLSAACSHTPVMTQNPTLKGPPVRYSSLFKKRTVHVDQYEGFYQTFQADVTILSTDMQEAGLDQRSTALKWTEVFANEQREKQRADAATKAKFYLRFYAPDRENDDLDKANSVWRVYLDVNGTRLDGKVRRLTEKLIELQTLYPNQDRFSSPYEVSFDIPMTTAQRAGVTFILTGNLGTAEFNFPPIL